MVQDARGLERGEVSVVGVSAEPGAVVLDLRLTVAGHQVTGVDISDVQVDRARSLVPEATFIRADATALNLPDETCDAVVCLYALIPMPLDQQPHLLRNIAR